ncbi:hypothetical protein HK097_002241 [Rhizophlyctis rosea]|uniref:Reticulon-like protein n=1 Tax=Rhizophlyctis rosea TaxID=64517 RepID=A0AAD5SIW3_9FUNG|nr:hypothetical protein HK097_002241 [Rhizophlyctis rosea]
MASDSLPIPVSPPASPAKPEEERPKAAEPVVAAEPEEPSPPPAEAAPQVGPGATPPATPTKKSSKKEVTEADRKAAAIAARVRSILLWENPIHSGIALSSILATIYLLSHYSPVRIISFVTAVVLAFNVVFVNAWVHTHRLFTDVSKDGVKKPPTTWYLDNTNRNVLHSKQLHVYADLFADVFNVSVGQFASLIAVDNNARSIEALFGSLALYWLSGLLSGWTLLTTIVILSFTAPPIYIANKGVIDEQVGHAQAVASTQFKTADSKVKSVFGKLGLGKGKKVKKEE